MGVWKKVGGSRIIRIRDRAPSAASVITGANGDPISLRRHLPEPFREDYLSSRTSGLFSRLL
jgi:hypothetical protein